MTVTSQAFMKRRSRKLPWARLFQRSLQAMARQATQAGVVAVRQALRPTPAAARKPRPAAGTWTAGVAIGASGVRRFKLYRPAGVKAGERLPLMVMLHGCTQDADSFAASTRMNRVAERERFLVLYPEQDRLANANGCWNWFGTASGRAHGEAALIMKAIDQVCQLQPVDRSRVAVAGLSAGASMAALLATRYAGRFQALVLHSGIPPGMASSSTSALKAMRGGGATAALPRVQLAKVAPAAVLAQWPPLLVIHGSADRVVAPQNAHAAVQMWAVAGGARAAPERQVQRGGRYPMQVTDFKRQGRTLATLVMVNGLAHAWSGGAASQPYGDARGPDASRMAWRFAAKQFAGSFPGPRAVPVAGRAGEVDRLEDDAVDVT